MNANQPQQRRRYAIDPQSEAFQRPPQSAQPQEQSQPAPVHSVYPQQANVYRQPLIYSKGSLYSPRPVVSEPAKPTEQPSLYAYEAQAQMQQQRPVQQQSHPADSHPQAVHADASYCPASGHYVPHSSRGENRAKDPRSAPRKRKGSMPMQPMAQRLLLVVCAMVFAVSAFLLIRYFANILITRRASAQLEAVYSASLENTEEPTGTPVSTATPAPSPTPAVETRPAAAAAPPSEPPRELWPSRYPQNPMLRVSSVFYELQRQNPDIIGWLRIDGVLEEAVVQRDNEYYLTHNALQQKSVTGALFLDETCDLKTVPSQMLIHGHNMKEGAMFGSLKKYKVKDASFYRAHPYVEFNTIYENSRFVIFAVAEVDLRWNKGNYLPFWQDVRFQSADAFMEYVKKARDLSHYRCNVDVVPGDRLLTLSTCTGTDDNQRLLIMARRIRDDEDLTQLNMSILTTGDR